MTIAGLPKAELESTLKGLRRMFEASRADYERKKIQYQFLGQELTDLGGSIRSLGGSIIAIEAALGLPVESVEVVVPVTAESPPSEAKAGSKEKGVTEAVMKIVAQHQEIGGIEFDEILKELANQGIVITREYMHTVLNRKKNHQKKLMRMDGQWFLTDKGKAEVGV
jgi:hypothetical protein